MELNPEIEDLKARIAKAIQIIDAPDEVDEPEPYRTTFDNATSAQRFGERMMAEGEFYDFVLVEGELVVVLEVPAP